MNHQFTSPFSVEDGIRIQQRQLMEWSRVLSAETHEHLCREATKDNDKARSGYEICRGDDLLQIIYTLKMRANVAQPDVPLRNTHTLTLTDQSLADLKSVLEDAAHFFKGGEIGKRAQRLSTKIGN